MTDTLLDRPFLFPFLTPTTGCCHHQLSRLSGLSLRPSLHPSHRHRTAIASPSPVWELLLRSHLGQTLGSKLQPSSLIAVLQPSPKIEFGTISQRNSFLQ